MHDIIILNDHAKEIYLRNESEFSSWTYSYNCCEFFNLGEGPYVIRNQTTDKCEVNVKFINTSEGNFEFYITKLTQFFIIAGENICFDGGKESDFDDKRIAGKRSIKFVNKIVGPKLGLFQNGDKDVDGFSGTKIMYMDYYSDEGTFHPGNGRFLQPFFGRNRNDFMLNRLRNYSDIRGSHTSGIAGDCVFQNSKNVVMHNCINYGTIGLDATQQNCNGLLGRYFMNGGSGCIINSCINFGNIESSSSSGIVGSNSLNNLSGEISISKCYNTGALNGSGSAGLVGFYSFNNLVTDGNISIINCFNSGKISSVCAGIVGNECFCNITSNQYSISIKNSYNNANLIGNNGSGIVGSSCFSRCESPITMSNCYHNGNMSKNQYNTGLVGNYMGIENNSFITIQNCYVSSNNTDTSVLIGLFSNSERAVFIDVSLSEKWDPDVARYTLLSVADRDNRYMNFNFEENNAVYLDSSNFFYQKVAYILVAYSSSDTFFEEQNENVCAGHWIQSITVDFRKSQYLYVSSTSEFSFDCPMSFVEYGYDYIYFEHAILTNENLRGGKYKSIFVVLNKYDIQRGYEIITLNANIINNSALLFDTIVKILDDQNVECEVKISELQIGDRVKIHDNTFRPVIHIYSAILMNTPQIYNTKNNDEKIINKLYIMFKHDFPYLLDRDTVLTGRQKILVDSVSPEESEMASITGLDLNDMVHAPTNKYRLDTFLNTKANDFDVYEKFKVYNIVLYAESTEAPYFYINGNMLAESLPVSFLQKI